MPSLLGAGTLARMASTASEPVAPPGDPRESQDVLLRDLDSSARGLSQRTFAAALIYVPAMQAVFGTAALPPDAVLFTLPFPVIVWGADALVRSRSRLR